MDILTYFSSPAQFWLILGVILLISELFGTAGYLLWSGLSALAISLFMWCFPTSLSLGSQSLIFAVLSLIIATFWWYWLNKVRGIKKNPSSLLNRPYLKLIGKRYTLQDSIINGYGRLNVGDSSWRLKCETASVSAGSDVIIQNIEGNTLIVLPVVLTHDEINN